MNREDEVTRLEGEADTQERDLEKRVGDVEDDLRAVLAELREVRLRLEEEHSRGAQGLGEIVSKLAAVKLPVALPLEGHAERVLEVRADHARARLWLASTLNQELLRFLGDLAPLMRLAEEGRQAVNRIAEQPRVRPRDQRLMRVQSYTSELASATRDEVKSARRRQLPRLRFEVGIDLHSRSNFYTGTTENISEGGIFIATEERLALGTPVELAFSLPSGEEIRARGEVRWQRESAGHLAGGMGVGFEELSEDAYMTISQFLESRAPIVREG